MKSVQSILPTLSHEKSVVRQEGLLEAQKFLEGLKLPSSLGDEPRVLVDRSYESVPPDISDQERAEVESLYEVVIQRIALEQEETLLVDAGEFYFEVVCFVFSIRFGHSDSNCCRSQYHVSSWRLSTAKLRGIGGGYRFEN